DYEAIRVKPDPIWCQRLEWTSDQVTTMLKKIGVNRAPAPSVPDVLEPAAQDRGRKYVRNPASIRHAFPDLTTHQAAEVITYWTHTSLFLLRAETPCHRRKEKKGSSHGERVQHAV